MKIILITALFALFFLDTPHTLTLSPLFSNGMVLQQSEKAAIWGDAAPNKDVAVSGSWGNQVSTSSDSAGNWIAYLETPVAGGPFEVTVTSAGESVSIQDVLIGEVWLASGQSNMEMDFNYCRNDSSRHSKLIKTC